MSRAFTKEDAHQEDVVVVARSPLPDGEPNLVTPGGLELLHDEERALGAELAAALAAGDERRIAALESAGDELAARLSSAVVVDPAGHDKHEVRFGDAVTLRPLKAGGAATGAATGAASAADREFTLRIVGVDEADPEEDLISHLAPLARALMGAKVGERVVHGAGGAEREVELTAIA